MFNSWVGDKSLSQCGWKRASHERPCLLGSISRNFWEFPVFETIGNHYIRWSHLSVTWSESMTPKASENNKRENLKMMHSWHEKSNTLEASKLRKVWKWFGRSIPTARRCFDVIAILVGLGQQCQCFLLLHQLLVMAQGSQEKWAKSNGSSAFPFCMSCIWFSVWVFSFFSDPWRDQAFCLYYTYCFILLVGPCFQVNVVTLLCMHLRLHRNVFRDLFASFGGVHPFVISFACR